MKKTATIIISLLGMIMSIPSTAQQTEQKFVKETKYLLYLPEGYYADTTKKWPLMLFLHGAGEVGDDLEKVKKYGPPELVAQGKTFPFIIISPQAQTYGWRPGEMMDLMGNIIKNYKVNVEKIYATGLSMGGYGVWSLAEKYPNVFAAIAPIAGGGDTSKLHLLRHLPVWCFHGGKDQIVPVSESESMMRELQKDNTISKFTVYPQWYHDSWIPAYQNDSLFTWLLSHKRFRHSPVRLSGTALKKFEGWFTDNQKDTVQYVVSKDTLRVGFSNINSANRQYPEGVKLIPAPGDWFYFEKEAPQDVRFIRNGHREITGFKIYDTDEKIEFKRISAVPRKNH